MIVLLGLLRRDCMAKKNWRVAAPYDNKLPCQGLEVAVWVLALTLECLFAASLWGIYLSNSIKHKFHRVFNLVKYWCITMIILWVLGF